jgi:hypothetical protein
MLFCLEVDQLVCDSWEGLTATATVRGLTQGLIDVMNLNRASSSPSNPFLTFKGEKVSMCLPPTELY